MLTPVFIYSNIIKTLGPETINEMFYPLKHETIYYL